MKTNHKISIMQAGLSVLCGVVLAVHRSRPASTGAAMAVVGLAAAIVLALGGLGICQLREKLQLKPASPDKLGFSLLALSGFLFLLAAAFFFLENTASLLGIIIALFCGFCGIATILRVSQRDSGKTAAVYSLVPIFFLSFFLLMLYRSNGDNPNLRLFGYEIAVMLLVLLGMYLAVAGRFEGDRPRFRSIGCSIGFCLIAQEMISFLLMPQMLLSIPDFSVAALVMLLACGLLLCYGMFFPSVREVFPEPAVEDADTSEEETENPSSPS
jgi:hypothetical protein